MGTPVQTYSKSPSLTAEPEYGSSTGGTNPDGAAFVGSFIVGQNPAAIEAQYPNNLDASAIMGWSTTPMGQSTPVTSNTYRVQFTPDGRVLCGTGGQVTPTVVGQVSVPGPRTRVRMACALDGTVTAEKTGDDWATSTSVYTFPGKATGTLHTRFYVSQARKVYQIRQVGLAQTVTAPVPAPPPAPSPAPGIATTFDNAYPAGWTPNKDRTVKTMAPVPFPVKSTSVSTFGYTDPSFGTKISRVSQLSDATDPVRFLRQDYSRRSPWNCNGSKYVLLAENGWWYVFDSMTRQRLNGGRAISPGREAMVGPAGACDFFWHPTDPNKGWYTDNNGGLVWYEYDFTTKTNRPLFDLTTKIRSMGGAWATAGRTMFKNEGMPSLDGRYWGLMVKTADFGMVGLIRYDRVLDVITGSVLTDHIPDHTSTSPLTGRLVASWYDSAGVRVYSPDCKTFKQTSILGQHSDLFIDKDGREAFSWISFHGDAEGVVDGSVVWCLLDDPAQRWSTPICVFPPETNVGDGVHISGACWARPGYTVVSIYSGVGQNPHSGRVMVVEMRPGGAVYRIADNRSNTGAFTDGSLRYASEPQAVPNRDLTRIMWASNMGSASNGIVAFEAALPSWAFPVL